jgi:catechol 2,3-dioxygenase-like lactoylglutathione lyase family enzyme
MTNPAAEAARPPHALGAIHHAAFRCRDAEQTRWFYEDVLNLPLAAALRIEDEPGVGRARPYMHLFFELGDGNYLAFFDDPDEARPDHFERAHGFDRHVALTTPREGDLGVWKDLLAARGVTCVGPIDHGFVRSIYMYDPNGLQVEITALAPDYAAIMAQERADARSAVATWSAQTRAHKETVFGAASLDRRGRV